MFNRKYPHCVQAQVIDNHSQYNNYYVRKLGLYSLVFGISAIWGICQFHSFGNAPLFYLSDILSASSYLSGVVFGIKSALKLSEHHENPEQNKRQWNQAITYAMVAALLLALPSFFTVARDSTYSNPSTVSSLSNTLY